MRIGPQRFSPVFAALMVLAAAWPAGQTGLAASAPATAAVLVGVFYRPAATVAVLLTVAAAALLDVPVLFAAGSGLSAAGYLVTRHGAMITVPAALGLVGFTAAGLMAFLIPLELAWAPLLAPAAIGLVLLVTGAPLIRGVAPRTPAVEPDPAA